MLKAYQLYIKDEYLNEAENYGKLVYNVLTVNKRTAKRALVYGELEKAPPGAETEFVIKQLWMRMPHSHPLNKICEGYDAKWTIPDFPSTRDIELERYDHVTRPVLQPYQLHIHNFSLGEAKKYGLLNGNILTVNKRTIDRSTAYTRIGKMQTDTGKWVVISQPRQKVGARCQLNYMCKWYEASWKTTEFPQIRPWVPGVDQHEDLPVFTSY
jgi:hypothetical protein